MFSLMKDRRIVALGDSLTEGRYLSDKDGIKISPYTVSLKQRIDQYLQDHENPFSVDVENVSRGGLFVGPEGLWSEYEPKEWDRPSIYIRQISMKSPDACIILAGSTNLGMIGYPINFGEVKIEDPEIENKIDELVRNLFSLYQTLTEASIIPISLTIPSVSKDDKRQFYQKLRYVVNEKIIVYSREHNIPYVDLSTATMDSDGWMLPEYCSKDGGHFNPKGYEKMAEVIFEQGVKPLLEKWMQK